MSRPRSLALAATGAVLVRATLRGLRAVPQANRLDRTNFRGRTVTLAAGPALAVAASTSAAAGAGSAPAAGAALVAGLGSGAVGFYDDVVGGRPEHKAKGFKGHLGALREGRLTSGLVKIAGVGAAALAASALLAAEPDRRARRRGKLATMADVTLGAGVIAGTANLFNLLDLRPGRAIKAGAILAAPLAAGPTRGLVAGPVGAAAGILPDDLDEQVMLGDAGANALGALFGVALAARTGPAGRAALLAGLAALTAASERVSFTQVIQQTPVLREIDAFGRRP